MSKTERANWTIAYRKPRANRFLRVSTWSGTWSQAFAMAALFGAANPGLQVYYTSSAQAEGEGFVCEEDRGNILVDSGRRVRIVETDVELPAEMIARIPDSETARERWVDGDPIADAEGAEPAGPFVALEDVAAEQNFEVRERDGVVRSVELRRDGRLVNAFRKVADARAWLAENGAHVEAQYLLGTIRAEGRPQAVTELLEQAELLTDCAEHLAAVRRAVALYAHLRAPYSSLR